MTMSDQVVADKLVRRRARVCTVFGILFMVSQASSLSRPVGADRIAGPAGSLAAWVVWAAILVLVVATGGGWLRTAGVRSMMNDESTRAHRLRALATGFWASLAATSALYVIQLFRAVPTGDALRLVVTVAVSASLMSFGAMERRALRDG